MTVTARDTEDRRIRASARFARWPGLLSLAVPLLVPPVVVLSNEEISYMTVPWACAREAPAFLHIVPFVSLVVVLLCSALAAVDWRRAGGGTEDEAATVLTRSRFLAILGFFSSVFSALIVIAMWLPMFIVNPCLRS